MGNRQQAFVHLASDGGQPKTDSRVSRILCTTCYGAFKRVNDFRHPGLIWHQRQQAAHQIHHLFPARQGQPNVVHRFIVKIESNYFCRCRGRARQCAFPQIPRQRTQLRRFGCSVYFFSVRLRADYQVGVGCLGKYVSLFHRINTALAPVGVVFRFGLKRQFGKHLRN